MSDYKIKLQEDWEDFVTEVKAIYFMLPNEDIRGIARHTGGTVEDVEKALKEEGLPV